LKNLQELPLQKLQLMVFIGLLHQWWTLAEIQDGASNGRSGEDTYLGSLVAKARVKGFQGNGLGNLDAVMACTKHFAAYGAGVGGRDYNSVDMSLRQLNETYLPPFKAMSEWCCYFYEFF
jgi:beta-glucosidase